MKKVTYIFTIIALSSTLMMGCGSKATNNAVTASAESGQPAENGQSTENAPTNDGSNKQEMFKTADLEGEVTCIDGNKITLKVIKSPEKSSGDSEQSTNNNGGPGNSNGKPSGSNEQTANNFGDPDNNVRKPANSDSNTNTVSPNNGNSQPSNQPNRQIEYTGETKEITISDGVTITSMSRGQQNSQSQTLSVSDIKVGNILQITYSDESNETISSINVMQIESQNSNANADTKTKTNTNTNTDTTEL